MNPSDDDDLRRLFDESRCADEEGARSFRRVLERERAAGPAPLRIGRIAAAAAAVAIFAISLRFIHRPPETRTGRIEAWEPPTDFLLEASFTDLYDTTPPLPGAVPDYAPLLATEKEKGKKS